MRMLSVPIFVLLAAGWGFSQPKPPAPAAPGTALPAAGSGAKSALDKASLEAYLRYLDLYRVPVTYKIDDPKPSKDLPGFSEVAVHLTFENGNKDELYY